MDPYPTTAKKSNSNNSNEQEMDFPADPPKGTETAISRAQNSGQTDSDFYE